MTLRMGIIGCGRIAQRFHIKNLLNMQNTKLIALCDMREEIARKIASKYQIETVYVDYKELLADEKIDAVVISTPPSSHLEILENAAKAGKHVFIEKPLAETVEECNKAIEACHSNGVKLAVGFMRRFDQALLWSRERIDTGNLGKPFTINSTYNNVSTYADYLRKTDADIIGEGTSSGNYRKNMHSFLSNHLVHHADLMRWMGGSVERLLAASVLTDDNFTLNLILKFSNKCMGHLQFNSLIKTDWRETLIIHGTKGSLNVNMFFPYLDTPSNAVFESHEIGSCISPLIVVNTMYEDELRYFVSCVINNLEPEPSGYQALEAQKIISTMEKSLENESWVDIK